MSADILKFPAAKAGELRPVPAVPGDLIVGRLRLSGDFGVLTVGGVDDEGAVATCLDVDGKCIAISRLFDLGQHYFIASSKLLTPKGRAELPGLCSSDISAIKAAFRVHAEAES
ncbi:hypothetical protein [Brevundimonas pondensis]|uniref:Uncharacterized protein n=1 Tax=Brevundimonas pondensis TaxID=2774189 RepID=A0ABX7SMZ9_9CAUL|nr:hypothetical protein [Brevundimonas pondensis]QTC88172.1 hypothetical protein IFE19_01835 [Brevundimonas pondensis]